MRRINPIIVLASLLLATACGIQLPPVTPGPVVTPPVIEQPAPPAIDADAIIVRVYADLLRRQPDPFGIDYYGQRLRDGRLTEASMRADVMASAEYKALHAPPPPVPVLTVRGKQFYAGDTLYVPRWVSGLTLLARTPEQQIAFLDWAAKIGFNGVRVFAGSLTWAGQTPESARAALTPFLDRAAARGLVVEVTALTDTGTGYDAKQHLIGVADRLAGRRGVVLELANEVGHPTQAPDITEPRMRAWGAEIVAPRGVLWAVGASAVDEPCPKFERPGDPAKGEPERVEITRQQWEALQASERFDRPAVCGPYDPGVYPAYGGSYSTAHLERTGDRKTWNVWRRVREIYAIAENHGAPAVDNEPEGCAEPGTRGQRYYDPAFAFAVGALDRAFGIGGVHHLQTGLMAEVPLSGKVEQACAEAYVAAHAAIESVLPGQVGQYKNVGHGGSPLLSVRFVEGGSEDGVVRAYSFISGDRGVTVLVGLKGSAGLEWGNGWRMVRTVASRTAHDGRQIVVLEVGR